MPTSISLTRRAVLRSLGLAALGLPLLQACGGSAPAAPASAPTSAATSAPASGPTAAVAAPTSAPAVGKVTVSVAVRTEANNTWAQYAAKQWAAKNPDVNLQMVQVPYNDMAKKQLSEAATGTLQDVVYSGIKWFDYSALKGVFRPVDDYVKSMNPGMADFFPDAVTGCTIDGKLYALPSELNTGNRNIVIINKDLLQKKGLTLPTDDWTVQQFVDIATKTTDSASHVYGTDFYPGTYYDFAALERNWGGELLSSDGKTINLSPDPKAATAAQWAVDLRTKYHAAPNRAESQGIAFPAGQIALSGQGIYALLSTGKSVGNKFAWDAVLFPKGPGGLRGYEAFIVMWSVAANSKQPEKAFGLTSEITSKEIGIWAVVNNDYQPNARKSVWASAEVNKISPVYKRVLAWITSGKDKGPFPMPYNARFSELEDKYENVSPPLWYGEVSFAAGMKKVQEQLQPIMQESRP